MTYEKWLKEWQKVRSNYLPDREEPTEQQLRQWYAEDTQRRRR